MPRGPIPVPLVIRNLAELPPVPSGPTLLPPELPVGDEDKPVADPDGVAAVPMEKSYS